jgi:deoxyhypusine synthase
MSKFKQIKLDGVRLISIKKRRSKVSLKDFAKVPDPRKARLGEFIDSLPRILAGNELRALVRDIARSRRNGKPVILMMGAHVIKVGLSPIVVDLVERRIITHVAMNSAAAIHDVETAMWGQTSEDVAAHILDGKFGMSKETGDFINKALVKAFGESNEGYGEALAKKLIALRAPHQSVSILAACYKRGVPVTVHAAIGTDIVHQQPTMDGAATGEMTFRDFKIFANSVKDLRNGGVVLNVGSAVVLPEVFLKALTVARNLGHRAQGFSTANFDMIRQYRPQQNVVERPTQRYGRGYNFTGHHEIMLPLLAAMIKLTVNRV